MSDSHCHIPSLRHLDERTPGQMSLCALSNFDTFMTKSESTENLQSTRANASVLQGRSIVSVRGDMHAQSLRTALSSDASHDVAKRD